MSVKNNNAVRGVLVPLDLWSRVCAVLKINEDKKREYAVDAVRNGITVKYKSTMISAWRHAQQLYNQMRDCTYEAFVMASVYRTPEERIVLTEYGYIGNLEGVRSFVGSMKQCQQKMAKWYRKRMREANRCDCDVCSYMEYDHALIQDDTSGSFRYEFWIKAPVD